MQICSDRDFNSLFECKNGKHPIIIKEHLKKNITTETLVILDGMLGYKKTLMPSWMTLYGKPSV